MGAGHHGGCLALLASSVNVSSQYLGNNENEMILNVCTTAAVGDESRARRGMG